MKHGNLKPENIYLYVDKQGCLKAGLTDPHLQLMFEEPLSDAKQIADIIQTIISGKKPIKLSN